MTGGISRSPKLPLTLHFLCGVTKLDWGQAQQGLLSPLIIPSPFPWLWCRWMVDRDSGNWVNPLMRVSNHMTRHDACGCLERHSHCCLRGVAARRQRPGGESLPGGKGRGGVAARRQRGGGVGSRCAAAKAGGGGGVAAQRQRAGRRAVAARRQRAGGRGNAARRKGAESDRKQ